MGLMVLGANAQTQLYGTCQFGGISNRGTIFAADTNGSNFHNVHLMTGIGDSPIGGMVQANNGLLYGVSYYINCYDTCIIFSFDPSTGTYNRLHYFLDQSLQGAYPTSGMILGSDGNLYGLCSNYGANGNGTIYRFNPTTNIYTDIFDFENASGSFPNGTLVQLNNGKLYGMTNLGGTNNRGVIFKFDPISYQYDTLASFNYWNGANPIYGSLLMASNNLLYGMASDGGYDQYTGSGGGVFFSLDTSTNQITDLHHFWSNDGCFPSGSLIQVNDSLLYGMATHVCLNNPDSGDFGVIFNYNILTNTYTVVHMFDSVNGSSPQRSLFNGGNGKLYGTTTNGGANNVGVAFSFDIVTNTYTKLIDFNDSTTGAKPNCDFVEATVITTGFKSITNTPTITLFPNPATTSITLHSQLTINNSLLTIEDVLGNKIYQQTISGNDTQIDISTWSEGVYFYEVIGANETTRGKFVKE